MKTISVAVTRTTQQEAEVILLVDDEINADDVVYEREGIYASIHERAIAAADFTNAPAEIDHYVSDAEDCDGG